MVLEALGFLAVVAAVIGLWGDFRARDEDRVHRAWQLVADRTGIRTALEFLHSRGEDLSGLELNFAYLGGAELRGAELEGIHLGDARLSGADLREANLAGAVLSGADLEGADLREANLAGAQLVFTDLRGANLAGVQVAGATLCGSQMPDGSFCNRDCDTLDPDRIGGPNGWRATDRTCSWFRQEPAP